MSQDNEPPATPKKVVGIRPDVVVPEESNVIELDTTSFVDIPPERVYNSAIKAELKSVIVIGYRPDGELYFASSTSDAPLLCWMLEHAKRITIENSV